MNTCTVCRHPSLAEINKAIVAGTPLRHIAKQYRLSLSAVHRHKESCIPEALVKGREAELAADSEELLKVSQGLLGNAIKILKDARDRGDEAMSLKANREAVRSLELHARLQGELVERVRQETLQVSLNAQRAGDGVSIYIPDNGRESYKDMLNSKINSMIERQVSDILGGEVISFTSMSRMDFLALAEAIRILRMMCEKADITPDNIVEKIKSESSKAVVQDTVSCNTPNNTNNQVE